MPYANAIDRLEWHRKYNAENRARIAEHQKRWAEKNPGYFVEWKSRNPGKVVEYRKKHQEKMRGTGLGRLAKLGLGVADARALLAEKGSCALCGTREGKFHLDHIFPRSRGGSNSKENLQWLCVTCNMSKGALTPTEFLAHIRKVLEFSDG